MNKKQPLVSICIPTYNSSKTIFETLKSIVLQSYENIEILIGDNNSTDNTLDIIKGFKQKNIKIYKNKKNIGPAANSNKLIKKAKGEYICIFHADDIYHKDIIKEEISLMQMFPRCGVVFTLRQLINEKGKLIKKVPLPFRTLIGYTYGPKELFFPRMLIHGNIFVCPSAMVRKSVYKDVGLYRTEKKYDSNKYTDESQMVIDQDMWLRIMEKYRIGIIDKYLINYRIHINQGSSILNIGRKTLSPEYNLYDDYIDKWEMKNKLLLRKYHKLKSRGYLFCAVNSLLSNDKKLFERNMKYSYFYSSALSFPFNIIRGFLAILPQFFMRIIILYTVKLLKILRLNRKYLFLNYI